jgi:hypothetical protein
MGLRPAHRAYYCEAVTRLPNIQVGDQRIEWPCINLRQALRHSGADGHLKPFPVQNLKQAGSNRRIIIDEQHTVRRHWKRSPNFSDSSYRPGAAPIRGFGSQIALAFANS